jgi:hypothetical protein
VTQALCDNYVSMALRCQLRQAQTCVSSASATSAEELLGRVVRVLEQLEHILRRLFLEMDATAPVTRPLQVFSGDAARSSEDRRLIEGRLLVSPALFFVQATQKPMH